TWRYRKVFKLKFGLLN
ncbi:putative dNA polymerase II, partial [Vibrio parahaemolyticus EKP-021]